MHSHSFHGRLGHLGFITRLFHYCFAGKILLILLWLHLHAVGMNDSVHIVALVISKAKL